MRLYASTILISFVILTSCKGSRELTNVQTNYKTQVINIEIPEQIKEDEKLNVVLTNNYDNNITLYDPMLIRIERLENNEWKHVKILHCPCGANCIPPPREKILDKGETWSYSWNLTESWCKEKKDQDIPETIEIKTKPGEYRFIAFYGFNASERIKLTKEFKIINNN